MNEFARVIGVFFEPGKTFADVAERPRWIVPILIGILIGLSFSYALNSHIGWETTIRQSLANNPSTTDMPADKKEEAIARGAKFASIIAWVGSIIGPPFFILIISGILTGLFNALMGTDLKFYQMFCVTAYAMLVRGLYTLLVILVMYLKPPEDFDIQVSPFSPAAYLSRHDTPKWLYSLAGSLDLFVIWTIVVLAIGFSAASKKISVTKSLTAIGIPWLVWVLALMMFQSFR